MGTSNYDVTAAAPLELSDSEELPVDSIGWFSIGSAWWVRRYYVAATKKKPTTERMPPSVLPRMTFADGCELNVKRLLGLLVLDEQTNGRINGSVLRVAWNFGSTQLQLACFLQTLSHLVTVLMMSVFLRIIMETIDASWPVDKDVKIKMLVGANNSAYFHEDNQKNGTYVRYLRNTDENWKIWYCSAAMVCSFMAICFLKSTSNAVSLRTAMRLRTACVGAVFSKSLKSSVKNHVTTHEVVSLCADEGDLIAALVMKGPNLVSHVLGLIFCVVTAVATLGSFLLCFNCFILFIVAIGFNVAVISALVYRRSTLFLNKKLSVLEEYYNSFNTVAGDLLSLHVSFKNRFWNALSSQYDVLSKSELVRASSFGGMTLVIMTCGIYFDFCYVEQVIADSTPIINLTIMYSLLVPTLISEIFEAHQAIIQGMLVLRKVKSVIFDLSSPELPKKRSTRDLKISISDATFRWECNENEMTPVDDKLFTLQIDGLTITKNHIIGITGEPGSGKTSLIYALLGHMKIQMGEFYPMDKCSFYPELPYTMYGGSIKANIVFDHDWEECRYQDALTLVKLHLNAGFDETSIEHVLDLQILQKISLARALYSDRDIVILEEPLSALDVESDLAEIFQVVTDKLLESGKTIIVVSENENILKHCQRVFLLTNGKISGFVDDADTKQIPAMQQVLENYILRKNAARENLKTTNVNLNNVHNISTEDLVRDDAEPTLRLPMPVSTCQSVMLLCLIFYNAMVVVLLPYSIPFYLTNDVEPDHCLWRRKGNLFFIPVIFIPNLLVKHFVNKIARSYNMNAQRDLFQKLLNSSLADTKATYLSPFLNTMLDNNIFSFKMRSTTLYLWSVIFIALFQSIQTNGFVCFVVLVPIFVFILRFYGYWSTINRFGRLETKTRLKLLNHVSNQLKGRAVIQSFDGVQKFRSKVYKAIDENTASVFIGRSVIHYNQLMFMLWQAVPLTLLLIILTQYPYIQDIYFASEVYVFMVVISHMVQLMDWRFTGIVADQKLRSARHLLQTITQPDHSTLRY